MGGGGSPSALNLGLQRQVAQDLLQDSGHLPPLAPLELPDFDYGASSPAPSDKMWCLFVTSRCADFDILPFKVKTNRHDHFRKKKKKKKKKSRSIFKKKKKKKKKKS